MERRGFLSGLFGGVVGAGLIVKASPADVEAFAGPLSVNEPMVVDVPDLKPVGCGDHLYNDRGELVAIVTKIHFGHHYTITAEGVGGFQVSRDRVRLRNS